MSLTVYADFSCPDCYLAAHRVDVLRAAGVAVVWRAVELSPHLPVGGRKLSADEQDGLAQRFAELDELLLPGESLPRTIPALLPKTEAAVSAYAEAYGIGVADDVRRLLTALYWQQGADIGSPAVLRGPLEGPILRSTSTVEALRSSGYAVSVDRGPITFEAWRRTVTWHREWAALGSSALPVVLTGGATLSGRDALQRLGKEIDYAQAPIAPAWDDPRRFPPAGTATPTARWVSWCGGRWRRGFRVPAAR
jgi:hypothetical protein